MEFDIEGKHADRAYALLASLVTPRPIAWVSTLSPDGVVNVAPFSFFNVLGANPPILGFCPGDREDGTPKDTAKNIRLTHEFVVNLVDENVAEAMNQTAASLPYGVSELQSAGLTTRPSSSVKPPRIAESPASLECKEWGTLQIGGNRLIIGLVKRIHVRDELVDHHALRIKSELLHVIGRMSTPHWYCRTRDRFEMKRPD
ncbi:MAG TPA: flavin reductase family protein [Verrucomicrobiae bacterium]|jgi:flavin reductase (DIM6/NTAB) family NADH-FMN oxidoreductase RutF|nr:flavin reductase family protein [Verrucomicrobiae bacterium]